MSSESDSESGDQFFDAEGSSPIKINRSKNKTSLTPQNLSLNVTKEVSTQSITLNHQQTWNNENIVVPSELDKKEIERKAHENEKRRRKLEEMRRRMQNEEDDCVDMGTNSQTSSIDNLYIHRRQLLPQVGDGDDTQSVVSLGKVGRILSGSETASVNSDRTSVISTMSDPEITTARSQVSREMSILQEPDLVASTKPERPTDLMPPPVPPRRKKKNKPILTPQSSLPAIDIPSPASTVDTLTKEFEHSLDIKSAIKGHYVVKPQDEEKDKAEGPLPSEEDSTNNNAITFSDTSLDYDDASSKQMNMLLRMRTDSGKQLTDLEIMEQVMVLNLDTGERVPLSLAEDRLPQCVNPLSLHIMRMTSEYVSNSSLNKDKESDDDDTDDQKKSSNSADTLDSKRKQPKRIKRLINRTVNKVKSLADEVKHARHTDDGVESSEDEPTADSKQSIKFKSASSHKGPYEFDKLKLIQDLGGVHSGAVWTMKFSHCGRLLATAGQDHILRVWVLKDGYDYFNNMRQKYNVESKVSPAPSQESLSSHQSQEEEKQQSDDAKAPFMPKPFFAYSGHTADLLDVSWSKNYFILSSSMDKTVRLWHISRGECLCCFQHIDFVTAIAFHPRDDRYFLSGSLDGKLRLWNIPDKKVALWNELDGQTKLITAANFCQNGKLAVVGSYDGRCIFYTTEQLKYYTQIHVRSTRGKNAKGRKISGIEPTPCEDKILVTSNDSRIRLYNVRDLSLSCKYKGYSNLSSQIRASFR
uniref:WD repeat-containing protein 44 n=1 Tax=Strigamia maritima TaxID=126957 RepID=T1JI81_STRMM